MSQHTTEMKNYKEKKFKGYKELECVFYSLKNESDAKKGEEQSKQQEKIDDVKSKVCIDIISTSLTIICIT